MSAVIRWRCDICGGESETRQRVETGLLTFFTPKVPEDWKRVNDGQVRRDLCSQRCVVAHYEGVVYREQRKLTGEPSQEKALEGGPPDAH